MDYEKEYKEALEKAKAEYNRAETNRDLLEYLFSELRESEDEKIRKEIICFLRNIPNSNYTCEEMAAWLEKQGVPTKYHDLCDSCVRQPTCQSDCFLQQSEQKHNHVLDIEIPFGAKDSELQEASYYIPEGFHAEIKGNRVVIKRGEHAWSEEDEKYINDLTNYFVEYDDLKHKVSDVVNWLKSLKPQSLWKPSDAQMEALREATNDHWDHDGLDPLYVLYQDLKKLRGE